VHLPITVACAKRPILFHTDILLLQKARSRTENIALLKADLQNIAANTNHQQTHS